MKHKLFLCVFCGFMIVKLLLSVYFPDCFIMKHVWLLYSLYFLVVTCTLFSMLPIVSLSEKTRIAECIMLGDGTITNEIFDNVKDNRYSLLCETTEGRAYSSSNGEMLYTKIVSIKTGNGDTTVISLVLYILFYSIICFYVYELILGLFDGTLDMDITLEIIKKKIATFNIFSSKYSVVKNLEFIWSVVIEVLANLIELVQSGYRLVKG